MSIVKATKNENTDLTRNEVVAVLNALKTAHFMVKDMDVLRNAIIKLQQQRDKLNTNGE